MKSFILLREDAMSVYTDGHDSAFQSQLRSFTKFLGSEGEKTCIIYVTQLTRTHTEAERGNVTH